MGAAVVVHARTHAHTHTHTFNGPFSGTSWVSQYQKGETNLEFNEARDSEWQWHQLGHMQVCTSLQTDNHASTPPLVFLQAGWPSCRPTNTASKQCKESSSSSSCTVFTDFTDQRERERERRGVTCECHSWPSTNTMHSGSELLEDKMAAICSVSAR